MAKTITLKFGGKSWKIPAKPPFGFVRRLTKAQNAKDDTDRADLAFEAVICVIGRDRIDELDEIDADTVSEELLPAISDAYGVSEGKSESSPTS